MSSVKVEIIYILTDFFRWSHVLADTVAGKTGTFNVIFVATTTGVIRKMLNLPTENEPCLIEEIKVTPNGDFKPIKQLRISKEHVSY